MATTKHTPGPWLHDPATLSGFNFIVFKSADTKQIFRVQFPGWQREQSLANAQLIAAAPELLALLTDFMHHVLVDASDYYKGKTLVERGLELRYKIEGT